MACIPEHYRGALDWMHPHAAYAEGKRVAEMMCTIMAHETGIDVRIARCFAFVGPHLPLEQHFAIGNFIADALAGRDISIRGDGTALRSYLYASDLALWLWTLLFMQTDSKGAPAVYNVGSGEAISINVLAEHLTAELNPNLNIKISQHAASCASASQYVPDVRKAAQLGLRPRIGLREAIRRTASWYR
jgi:dTDP-glucose 4,6-dehydratase